MSGGEHESDAAEVRVDEALAAVSRDVPTKRDLWAGIEAQLEPRSAAELAELDARTSRPAVRRSWGLGRGPYALAATVAALAVSALLVVALERRSPGGAPVQASNPSTATQGNASPDAATPRGERSGALLAAAFDGPQDERYRRTRAELERTFEAGLAVLAPETRTRIQQNLELIRRANADIRAALASDPNSPLLHQLLESTWQQEIDLYTTVGRNVDPALPRTRT